jgi:hypothetical protein
MRKPSHKRLALRTETLRHLQAVDPSDLAKVLGGGGHNTLAARNTTRCKPDNDDVKP